MEEKDLLSQPKLQLTILGLMENIFQQMVNLKQLGKRDAIIAACEIALKNLDISCIDLFYMHRMD